MSLLGLLGRKPPAPAASPPVAGRGTLFAPPSTPSPSDASQVVWGATTPTVATNTLRTPEPGLKPPEDAVIRSMADVPKFIKALSIGEHCTIKLAAADQSAIIVLDTGGQCAVILIDVDRKTLDTGYVRGQLISAGYKDTVIYWAEQKILQDITAEVVNKASSRQSTKNEFVAVLQDWMEYAHQNGATDIHMRCQGNLGIVRFRVDGELEEMRASNKGVYTAEFLKNTMAALFNSEQERKSGSKSIFNPDSFLYCMIPYSHQGREMKLRFQSLKGNKGPAATLRILNTDPNYPIRSYEELGYAPSHIKNQWEPTQAATSGAIIVAGVTGSGKSTTGQRIMSGYPSGLSKITIEDPVEYPIPNAHQIPIQRDLANTKESQSKYREVVASIMRSDPDIVMLGEVRDTDSAQTMMQLAESGHVALTTLHAHLITTIVPRLVNPEVGLTRQALTAPNILTLLVYQALSPILCPECAMTTAQAKSADAEAARVASQVHELGLSSDVLRWKRPTGCAHCKQRGTVGLTVVAEMMMPDEPWLDLIRVGEDAKALRLWRLTSDGNLESENMDGKTVFEHALWKAMQGQIDVRQCERFQSFYRFIADYQRLKKGGISR